MEFHYEGIDYRDINHFITDLQNHLLTMVEIYNEFVQTADIVTDEKEVERVRLETAAKLQKELQKLKDRLDFVTDRDRVPEAALEDAKVKLNQFKNLCSSLNFIKDTEGDLMHLVDYYQNRILEKNIAITGRIFKRKK
ncbi:MAG: hypothetical protein JW827_03705 [Spirochaetes bacterium]|nr:hypothetical protein [Spirochaetota bacterium]